MTSSKRQKKKSVSLFIEQEDTIQSSNHSRDIEDLFDAVASVSPFETPEVCGDIDDALNTLNRLTSSEEEPDEELERMKKMLGT